VNKLHTSKNIKKKCFQIEEKRNSPMDSAPAHGGASESNTLLRYKKVKRVLEEFPVQVLEEPNPVWGTLSQMQSKQTQQIPQKLLESIPNTNLQQRIKKVEEEATEQLETKDFVEITPDMLSVDDLCWQFFLDNFWHLTGAQSDVVKKLFPGDTTKRVSVLYCKESYHICTYILQVCDHLALTGIYARQENASCFRGTAGTKLLVFFLLNWPNTGDSGDTANNVTWRLLLSVQLPFQLILFFITQLAVVR
jgi:hypothetical protein